MQISLAASMCIAVALVTGTVLGASSDVPPGCQGNARTERAYAAGVQSGRSLVERAWLSVDDCRELEYFSEIVHSNVEAYVVGGSSAYSICRYTGLVDGALAALDAVWAQCGGPCCRQGTIIGTLAAEVYCQLSFMLDGLSVPDDFIRRPVCTCGGFNGCCASSFADITRTQCERYTVDSYSEVWAGTRALLCGE